MTEKAAPRRSFLFWITPPAFAAFIGFWSVEHRVPLDPLVSTAHARSGTKHRVQRGEHLPQGTAEISGTITAPAGHATAEVEISLAREEWIAQHNPATWRCCESCSFGLFDEYCEHGAQVVARLDALGRGDIAPSRVTLTRGGHFTFTGLPPGRYAIWGAMPRGTLAIARDVAVGDRQKRTIVLDSRHRSSLAGTILSAADGSPAIGATVVAIDPRLGKTYRAEANDDGEIEIDNLDPDVSYFVAAWADGLAPLGRASAAPGDEIVMELEDAGAINGSVSVAGKPAPNVKVDLDEIVDATVTDAGGKFKFEGLAPGMHLVRAANDAGFGYRVEVELGRGLARKLDLQLAPVCTLIVNIRDSQGALSGADVRLFAKGSIDHRVEKTDETGMALFEMLPLGTYELEARRSDRGKTSSSVHLDEACSTGETTLDIPNTAGVRGRVVDENDQPISGVEISLEFTSASSDTSDDVPRVTQTNDKGRFQVPSLGVGSWELTAMKPGFIQSVVSFEMEDPQNDVDLEIALSAGGTITGQVVDPAGAPMSGWIVFAHPPTADPNAPDDELPFESALGQRRTTGPDGSFALFGLKAGEYVLEAQPPASNARFTIESVETHAPHVKAKTGDTDVVITTRGTGALTGQVSFSGAPPPESFSVGVPGAGVRSFAGQEGRFRFDRAIAASYPVLLHARGFSNAIVRVSVERDMETEVNVTMHASARLEGKIVSARDGRPIADATVISVMTADGKEGQAYPSTTTSRRDGAFELRDLAPGQHWLNVQADGHARARVGPYQVEAGKRAAPVEIRLERANVRVSGNVHRGELALPEAVLMLHVREPKESIGLVENARSNTRGDFVFESVEPGTHLLTAAARLDGAKSETIIHRRALTVPVTGLEGIDVDVSDRGERAGKQRLAIELVGKKRDTVVVTLGWGTPAIDGDPADQPILATTESRVLEGTQREVVFDKLAPGAYTIGIGQLTAHDASVLGYAIGNVRPIASKVIEVRDKTRETRVQIPVE